MRVRGHKEWGVLSIDSDVLFKERPVTLRRANELL